MKRKNVPYAGGRNRTSAGSSHGAGRDGTPRSGFVGREMDGSVYSGTTDGQRLYYSDGFSLMVWQPENETPQVLISGKSWREAGLSTPGTRPVHTGETLLLMDNDTKKIWRWTGEDLAPVLNYAGTPLDALAQNIRALFWQDGALYLVCGDTTSSTMYLVRADIADGSAQALALEGYVHLSSYRDGLLLGIRGARAAIRPSCSTQPPAKYRRPWAPPRTCAASAGRRSVARSMPWWTACSPAGTARTGSLSVPALCPRWSASGACWVTGMWPLAWRASA